MIVISSDLEELLAISHRVMVMANGSVKGEFLAKDVSGRGYGPRCTKVGRRFGSDAFTQYIEIAQRSGVLAALVVLCIFFTVVTNTFLTVPNILNILRQVSITGLIVMFMTMLVIGNDIDLSVGSNFATVGMIVALLFQNGTNIWLASLIGLIVGGLLGLANGLITVKAALPPFIVTLGTQMIYRGLALVISGGAPASVRLPAAFYNITGARTFWNLPVPALWFIGITILAAFLLHKTSYGFKVYATGGNEEAARLSGINTSRVRIINFVLVGMSAALAGIIQMAYLQV